MDKNDQFNDPLDRPTITSLEEQKCQEDYQTTMLEYTNKYRSWYGLKPLQGSKKLQYVALLTAQRCHVLGPKKAVESFLLFNTAASYGFNYNQSINECKKNAVSTVLDWYESENWAPLDKEENFSYVGCAVSIFDTTAFHVCYYQIEKGADKLKLDIVPTDTNIDLESYKDSFWTQFPGKSKIKRLLSLKSHFINVYL